MKYLLTGISVAILLVWITVSGREAFPKEGKKTLSVFFSGGALGRLEPCG